MTLIISHRGIDTEKNHSFTESSRESFQYFLDAGYGIEFDIQITKDSIPVISHDTSLARIAKDDNLPQISEMTVSEFLETKLPNGHTLTLAELMSMMERVEKKSARLHALHLKHHNQTKESLSLLLPFLKETQHLSVLVFDVKPDVAKTLKVEIPNLQLAASVADSNDIIRYNKVVGGTLISIEDAISYRNYYDWVWLDEWDKTRSDGGRKNFYSKENFEKLHEAKYKIAIVSPELHATSPKLLGGEAHPDGQNLNMLIKYWQKLSLLKPDSVCTDYPKICSATLSAAKKPHIALCLSGQPRSIKEAYPYIRRNIIDCNENVDVFVHSWFNAENAGKKYKETSDTMTGKEVPVEDLNTPRLIEELYKPLRMELEPQQDFTAQSQLFQEIPRDATNTFGSLSMWTSIKKANQLKSEYEQDNNFTYDFVIRARFDCIPLRKIKVSQLDTNAVHGQGITDQSSITLYDQIIVGSSKNMDYVSDIIDHIFNYLPKVNLWNNEHILRHHLQANNIPIATHSWYIVLIRKETAMSAIRASAKNYLKSDFVKALSKGIKAVPLFGNKYAAWRSSKKSI